ncbi:hypothetical protein HYW32_02610 [Candidatus Berkelbacteria bacterium]|nr:hypothetical protein [Candidatus Berkelbacteria bacterium]
MTKIKFGTDLDFATNRWPEPEEWARILSEELGVRHAQFRSDLIQPHFSDEIIEEQASGVREACKEYDIRLEHAFTSQRWAYCGHPDGKIRQYWHWWLKRYSGIAAKVGARSAGSRFGIYSVKDFSGRRDFILAEMVKFWKLWAAHSKNEGLDCITFENLSIPREIADTIEGTRRLMEMTRGSEIPILPCLDTDQGNTMSGNPKDGDPYEWLREFGKECPILHLKQRIRGNASSGKPFTPENNRDGMIIPEKVVEALEESGAREINLYLELSFRERLPQDSNVIRDLKQSVDFWKPYADE